MDSISKLHKIEPPYPNKWANHRWPHWFLAAMWCRPWSRTIYIKTRRPFWDNISTQSIPFRLPSARVSLARVFTNSWWVLRSLYHSRGNARVSKSPIGSEMARQAQSSSPSTQPNDPLLQASPATPFSPPPFPQSHGLCNQHFSAPTRDPQFQQNLFRSHFPTGHPTPSGNFARLRLFRGVSMEFRIISPRIISHLLLLSVENPSSSFWLVLASFIGSLLILAWWTCLH